MNKFKYGNKISELLKEKKVIGCIALIIIFFAVSFFIYGQSKNKIFKDEYMKDIFVEDNSTETSARSNDNLNKEATTKSSVEKVPIKKGEVTVEIKGEVKSPKVYTLNEGAIINDLIEKAGGLTNEAYTANINRAKVLKNEDLIIIGNNKDLGSTTVMKTTNDSGIIGSNNSSKSTIININTATLNELMNIDGVGEKTAQKIIDYREENGGFKSIEDIKNVDRIGDKTFEKIKNLISC